jgi:regulator of replication initiation timing
MSDPTNNLSQVMEALQQLQLENEVLQNSLQELQARTSLPSQLDEPNLPP